MIQLPEDNVSDSSNKSFFEVYAHEYDLLTNAETRRVSHAREVEAIIERTSPHQVLDAGCATGLTARLFAERGIEAVGIDRSREMIKQARSGAQSSGPPLSFITGEFEKLPRELDGQFDLIVCLANAIVGVETAAGLRKALRGFHRLLKPGGNLVIQMLNYLAVKEGVLRPIKASRHGDLVYERFNERRGRKVTMYVTRADFGTQPAGLEVFRTDMDSFDIDLMIDEVQHAQFKRPRRFGNLMMTKRFSKNSPDLVLLASRPAG